MATLVLSVVGGLLGGPIGAAIGAALGQQVDTRLLAPKGGKGPRLGDLTIQTSTYGAPIPKLFGRTRVSGSVIWATDLIEDRRKVSTGKGRPKQTVYSYSANFAVALSARPIVRIGRIWADGKLLRGEGGDFKTETQFRLHEGGEDQPADPFILAAEGLSGAPAYRGIAYAMFEDFQLADYGNRIPSLSFEVIADEGPVAAGTIITSLGRDRIGTDAPSLIEGIAVTGESLRGVVEALSVGIPLLAQDTGAGLFVSEEPVPGLSPNADDLGATADGKRRPLLERERRGLSTLPRRRTLSYQDVDRDYQLGSQSLLRPDLGPREQQVEMAASLTSVRARQMIERTIAADIAGRDDIKISVPWRNLTLSVGQIIMLPGIEGHWLVAQTRFEAMVVEIGLLRRAETVSTSAIADPGRGTVEADTEHGPTVLRLYDLPWLGSGVATAPMIVAMAAGTMPGWRRAGLLQSNDGGLSFVEIGQTAPPATLGSAVTLLGTGASYGFDTVNFVDVQLLHGAMVLHPSTEDGLVAGQILAKLGDELFQFLRADLIGPARYRLSGLLRGRRGTEWAMAGHGPVDLFALIESDALLVLTVPEGTATVLASASGTGDPVSADASLVVQGHAMKPLAPVLLRSFPAATGDTLISWVRRSRDGWRWIDHVDAPLIE